MFILRINLKKKVKKIEKFIINYSLVITMSIKMYDSKKINDLTPKELGNYALNVLVTGCPLINTVDYTPDPINELAKLTKTECKEIVRYANHLAEKEGLGKNYFDSEKAKANLPLFESVKPSGLERKLNVSSATAA